MRTYFVRIPILADILYPKAIWRIKSSEVFLTFDDGPNPEFTPQLLELLRKYNIKCTFFLLTEKCILFPELVAQIKNEGHLIGFHGHTHKPLKALSEEEFTSLMTPPEILNGVRLYRPTFGKFSRQQLNRLSHCYKVIMYNRVIGDFDSRAKDVELQTRMKEIKPGDIVLLHENQRTLNLLEDFFLQIPKYNFNSLRQIN